MTDTTAAPTALQKALPTGRAGDFGFSRRVLGVKLHEGLIHHGPHRLLLLLLFRFGERRRGATGQRDLHQIARRELATALAELDVRAILAERVPGTVLVALYPQPLAHGNSSCPVARRSRQSVIPI